MDIVAVDGVDAESNYLGRVFWAGTGRSGEDGYIHVLQLGDVVYYIIISQFGWFVLFIVFFLLFVVCSVSGCKSIAFIRENERFNSFLTI